MVGLKRHIKQLTSELKSNGIVNYTTTEFSQGKTMRWGFAWSLYPGVQLFPGHPDIISVFSNFSTLLNFESLISSYLSELKLHTMKWLPVSPTEPEAPPCLEVVATSNTWSHQRRRRREMERQQGKSSPGEGPSPTKTKRTSEGSSAEMECDDDDLSGEMAVASSNETKDEDETILIHFLMDFVREGEDAKLILRYRGGCLGKDGMNQILQFLKNRFAKDCRDPESFVCQIASSS
jgi:methyltransferase